MAAAEFVIDVARNGAWPPVAEFHALALAAVDAAGDVTLDLGGIDHLECGALQIMLALTTARRARGAALRLANVSVSLSQWLEWVGSSTVLLQVNGNQKGELCCG